MVLLEIDVVSVSSLKFERDAPRAVDMHRIAGRTEAMEGMEVKTREVHFLHTPRSIEAVETDKDALLKANIHLRARTLEKLGQFLALEGSDHFCKLAAYKSIGNNPLPHGTSEHARSPCLNLN